MRNRTKIIIIIFLVIGISWFYLQRRQSYSERLKWEFGINIKDLSLSLVEERHIGEIDAGYYFARIKLEKPSDVKKLMAQRKFNKMPIDIPFSIYEGMQDIASDTLGLFFIEKNRDKLDYKIIIIDTESYEIIVYDQYF